MIQIDQLYKRYGKNEVLKGVDLNIPEGGIYAVLGPNGSGKTTILNAFTWVLYEEFTGAFNNPESLINKRAILGCWLIENDYKTLSVATFLGLQVPINIHAFM